MKNRILVYDDNCPLCSWYSSLFVKCRLLPVTGRQAFSQIDDTLLQKIDYERGRNEIPFVDLTNGKTYYGIDALLEILGDKVGLIKKIGRFPPVYWLLGKLYRFISFNRKVIVAIKCGPGSIDCTPDLNYRYRFLFLLVSMLFTTLMLAALHGNVLQHLSFYHLTSTEVQVAHFTLIGINCVLSMGFKPARGMEYLGQVNMLAVLAILLLSPLLILAKLILLPEWITGTWFMLVMIVVFREYLRRMQYAGILASHSWTAGINLTCMVGFVFYLFF